MICTSRFTLKSEGKIHQVACGSCLPCRINKKTFWQNRIAYDVMAMNRKGLGSTFAGLSIDDNHITTNYSLVKDDLQKVIKRLRHHSPIKFTHFSIGEYGDDSKRPHYHSILIGVPSELASDVLRKSWKLGFFTADPVTSGRIRYVVDYLDCVSYEGKKTFEDLGLVPPFNLHSNGIGMSLFNSQKDLIFETGHYLSRGKLFPISQYWLNKLGVPISVRSPSLEQLKEWNNKAKHLGFSNLEAYKADKAHTAELIAYNRQITRLSPRYGKVPSRRIQYGGENISIIPSVEKEFFV